MLNYKIVKFEDLDMLANLASSIWHEYWTDLLSAAQIDYMVEKFQSKSAIENQLQCENYTYYFIIENNSEIGYFGISDREDFLFLSKLYLAKNARHKGFGTMSFKKIKEIASQKGYKSIRLTVNKYNKNTISAYKKWGFEIIDSVVTDIGNGFVMDDFIMEYKL